MKVLFLDVDGVLKIHTPLSKVDDYEISNVMMERVAKIVSSTGCVVCVTSTWRLYKDAYNSLRRQLYAYGIKPVYRTESLPYSLRSKEIEEWLDRHNVVNYAVVDDDADAMVDSDRFFRTSYSFGLDDSLVDMIIESLVK